MRRTAHVVLKGPASTDPLVREAITAEREAGHDIGVSVTYEAGDATRFAAAAARSGVDVVVAGGGDGTLNEVARGLLAVPADARPAMGILPLGTANDFARTCDIPFDRPDLALRLALIGPARPIDVGTIDREPFLNIASFGIGARIVRETPQTWKSVLGGAAYSLSGLATLARSEPFTIELESDDLHWRGNALVIAVANARTAGGGYQLAPVARLDDGVLDILIVPQAGLTDYAKAASELSTPPDEVEPEVLIRGQAKSLRLTASGGIPFNLDGEPRDGTCFDIGLVPGALRVVAGPNAPLG